MTPTQYSIIVGMLPRLNDHDLEQLRQAVLETIERRRTLYVTPKQEEHS